MPRRIIFLLALVVATAVSARAQDKPAVYLQDGLQRIRFEINPVDPLDLALETKLGQVGTYRLYEVEHPDDPDKMRGVDITSTHLSTQPGCLFRCTRVDLQMDQALEFGKTYILKVADLPSGGSPHTLVRFQVAAVADVLPSIDQSKLRREIRVQSQVPIRVASPLAPVSVERKTLEQSADLTVVKDTSTPMEATLVPNGSSSENDLTLALDDKLNEGQTYNFAIRDQIVVAQPFGAAGPPTVVKTTGTVKVPGQPAPPDKPKVDFRISSDTAVDQKPQFNMVTSLTPLGDIQLGKSDWYWVPKVNIDVGLGQSKSSNSVTLNFPFRRDFIYPTFDCPEPKTVGAPIPPCPARDRARARMDNLALNKGEIKTPTSYEWSQVPWYRLNSIRMFLSPLKLESDRKFQRINVLGNARFEFNFYKLLRTIKDKRTRLEADLQDKAAMVEVTRGLRLVPYLSFDMGGHVKNETVKNTKKSKSLVVPRHDIFRGYFGTQALFQWQLFSFPMTLTLDEHLLFLAAEETIGFVTDDGVAVRRLRGFHHRGQAAWDTYLDPGKHYSFNVTYENGRLAPNFEYLNKLSVGFRVIY